MRLRLFSKSADLPEGVVRLPIKSIHLNKSPMVMANLKVVSDAMAQRWGIDMDLLLHHAGLAQALPDMSGIWPEVFERPDGARLDVDEDLYGGFVGNGDRRRLNELRTLTGTQLADAHPAFDDERLPELLFRYRARNFPDSLSEQEAARWEAHRAERLFEGAGGARTVEQLFDAIDQLSETADERGEAILGALYDYAESIAPQRS
jgi:exodeoxyribonuclease-1